jgi:hypothetical protein
VFGSTFAVIDSSQGGNSLFSEFRSFALAPGTILAHPYR